MTPDVTSPEGTSGYTERVVLRADEMAVAPSAQPLGARQLLWYAGCSVGESKGGNTSNTRAFRVSLSMIVGLLTDWKRVGA